MKEQSRRQSSGGRKDSSSISFSFFISATVQNWGNISLTQLANGPHTAMKTRVIQSVEHNVTIDYAYLCSLKNNVNAIIHAWFVNVHCPIIDTEL